MRILIVVVYVISIITSFFALLYFVATAVDGGSMGPGILSGSIFGTLIGFPIGYFIYEVLRS